MTSSESNTPSSPAHREVISMMHESTPPPSDGDSFDIPDELLKRLEEKFGEPGISEANTIIPMELPDRGDEQSAPTPIIGRTRRLLRMPQFAIAATLLLLGAMVSLWHSSTPSDDPMRGGKPQQTATVYWLSKKVPIPTGAGMPKFVVSESSPANGNAILCDPAQRSATLQRDDHKPGTAITITDPADNDEWLSAIQQLKTQLSTP